MAIDQAARPPAKGKGDAVADLHLHIQAVQDELRFVHKATLRNRLWLTVVAVGGGAGWLILLVLVWDVSDRIGKIVELLKLLNGA